MFQNENDTPPARKGRRCLFSGYGVTSVAQMPEDVDFLTPRTAEGERRVRVAVVRLFLTFRLCLFVALLRAGERDVADFTDG